MKRTTFAPLFFLAVVAGTGCGGAVIQPGHRAIFFDPKNGGAQHEVLQPGWQRLACPFWRPAESCPRLDDFDVTYTTRRETVRVVPVDGYAVEANVTVSYRPIVAELYMLDTEVGRDYYGKLIGPEFRAATEDVMASATAADLRTLKDLGGLQDRIEKSLRQRLAGRHVEIDSVIVEKVDPASDLPCTAGNP